MEDLEVDRMETLIWIVRMEGGWVGMAQDRVQWPVLVLLLRVSG
jgi:hypothetical protein